MLENAHLSTVKLKNISKQEVSCLPSYFGLYLKKELNFYFFLSFIDLGLHIDLCEHENYNTFVAKAAFSCAQKST